MSAYNTEQKKLLMDYLLKHGERAFSAEDIVIGLESDFGANAPGKSTVYRLLPKLYEEGRVKRFVKRGCRKMLYQVVDSTRCHNHLHMKCLSCGKLLHMSDAVTNAIFNDIHDNTEFHMDRENTVLFGLCGECGHPEGQGAR